MRGELGPMLTLLKCRYTYYTVAAGLSLISLPVHADTPDHEAAKFASGSGNILYLAAGVGLPLLSDGRYGTRHALRVADALGTSVLLSEALKIWCMRSGPTPIPMTAFRAAMRRRRLPWRQWKAICIRTKPRSGISVRR